MEVASLDGNSQCAWSPEIHQTVVQRILSVAKPMPRMLKMDPQILVLGRVRV